MKSTLSKFFIFTAGAAIGSAVTWKFLKTKYEQIAQEEIDSVKEVFSRRSGADVDRDCDVITFDDILENNDSFSTKEKPDIREYAVKLAGHGYVDYSNNNKTEESKETNNMEKPYVIAPEEFGECDDYETVSLTYYADGYLTDDRDELVEDADNVVGLDSLKHFGEYEDDSVFVRNDRLKVDYEILLDLRNYADVINNNPHTAED